MCLSTLDDPALHPEAFQEGRGETAAQEVRAHPQVPPVQQAKEPLRRHPHSAGVRWMREWTVWTLCVFRVLKEKKIYIYLPLVCLPSRSQEALKTGHFVSVLQVLMQLQRVCNHPELVAPRENGGAFFCPALQYNVPSLVLGALQDDADKVRCSSPRYTAARVYLYLIISGVTTNLLASVLTRLDIYTSALSPV